jgi:hypothetical protein
MEATLPVEKKADWSKVRKKTETRRSVRVRARKGLEERDAGILGSLDGTGLLKM